MPLAPQVTVTYSGKYARSPATSHGYTHTQCRMHQNIFTYLWLTMIYAQMDTLYSNLHTYHLLLRLNIVILEKRGKESERTRVAALHIDSS